jgi:cytochrome oxidase Cu insertion factor (SCO1/SenC/PrrC family)
MPIEQLPETAPDFTLDHVLGDPVSLSTYRGRRVVIVFGGRESAEQIKNGISAIRRTYDPDELTIIGVSDLRAAPRPARILVKSQLKKAYEEAVQAQAADLAAAGKPPREDPSKDVLMLMDWSGEVVDQYGLSGVDHEAAAVAVDADGKVLGSGSGEQLGPDILAALGAS